MATYEQNADATPTPAPPRDRGPGRLRRPGLLYNEPGANAVADHIADGAVISAVNHYEVATILIRHGRDPQTVLTPLRAQVEVVAFTDTDALTAAQLYPHVSSNGLSLGDRACLALAQRLTAPAVTAEHIWADIDLDITILGIRLPGP